MEAINQALTKKVLTSPTGLKILTFEDIDELNFYTAGTAFDIYKKLLAENPKSLILNIDHVQLSKDEYQKIAGKETTESSINLPTLLGYQKLTIYHETAQVITYSAELPLSKEALDDLLHEVAKFLDAFSFFNDLIKGVDIANIENSERIGTLFDVFTKSLQVMFLPLTTAM